MPYNSMTRNPNADLPPHKQFKHLYLGENYDVVDLDIDDGSGDCTFKTGDGEVEVSGSNQDFLDQLSSMVKIKEGGEYKYVDVEDYPVGSKQSFSENLELFETSDDDDPVQEAVERINNGSVELPEEFDLIEGVECIIESDFDNEYADYIVNNCYLSVAILKSYEHGISKLTNQYQEKANNTIRYGGYIRKISEALDSRYISTDPDSGLKRWRQYCKNDLLHFGEQVISNIIYHRESARRMAKGDISTDGPIIKLVSVESESSIGGLEPEIGLREIAQEYTSILESIKPLLKDLLVTIEPGINRSEIKSLYNIKEGISKSDYSFLKSAIEPQLRHGDSHSNIQINEDENKVVIYDRDDSNPSIKKEISYDTVVNTINQIEDLAAALLHTFSYAEYKIIRRFLESEEFKHHCSLYYGELN
ncbi:hypothetical protein V9T20_11700 (plasmid) [Halobacterium salinarum]|uniref:hypothetical protein n=1 Tax=Halobacterium salinarum TaxID=2242 RepID=UPI0030CF6BF0